MTGVPDEEKVINKKPDNLFSGVSVENLIKAERLPAGEWTRGMVIGKKDDGTCGLIGDTGFDETNICCISLCRRYRKEYRIRKTGLPICIKRGQCLFLSPSSLPSDFR